MRPQGETTFGRRLAALRNSRGLTQIDLAKRIRKTRPAIGRWEAGRAFIRGRDLARVARALECRMRDLLAPPDAPIPPRWPRRETSKRRAPIVHLNAQAGRSARITPTSAEAAELERLKALLLEVVHLLARHEPDALALLDRITASSGSDARHAA
jgi:transcriptional regulator with XRE-family HTH domain